MLTDSHRHPIQSSPQDLPRRLPRACSHHTRQGSSHPQPHHHAHCHRWGSRSCARQHVNAGLVRRRQRRRMCGGDRRETNRRGASGAGGSVSNQRIWHCCFPWPSLSLTFQMLVASAQVHGALGCARLILFFSLSSPPVALALFWSQSRTARELALVPGWHFRQGGARVSEKGCRFHQQRRQRSETVRNI